MRCEMCVVVMCDVVMCDVVMYDVVMCDVVMCGSVVSCGDGCCLVLYQGIFCLTVGDMDTFL